MKTHICYLFCCLPFFIGTSQTKQFILDIGYTIQVLEELHYTPIVFEVEESDLLHSKVRGYKQENSSIVDQQNLIKNEVDSKINFFVSDVVYLNQLSGSFLQLADYVVVNNNENGFFKNELITKDVAKKSKISKDNIADIDHTTLIKCIETNKYYFVKQDFSEKFDFTDTLLSNYNDQLLDVKDDNKRDIVASEIDEEHTLEQYKAMIRRCRELTTKLIVHNKLLIKRWAMTKSQTTELKRDLVEARLLSYRIDDFNKRYSKKNQEVIKEHFDKEALDSYINFSNVLMATESYANF